MRGAVGSFHPGSGDMTRPRDVRGVICEFECGYEFAGSPVMQELERSVLGCDYGATSRTTRVAQFRYLNAQINAAQA
jgi:hypothetical protein